METTRTCLAGSAVSTDRSREVEIDIVAEGPGSMVTIVESPIRGPISRLPRFITDPLLTLRNALSLQRLRHEIERKSLPDREALSTPRSFVT